MRRFDIAGMSFTITVGQRDDTPEAAVIENVGISPDQTYVPTARDFREKFKPMKAAIVKALVEGR